MIAVPPDIPETVPTDIGTVATVELPLVHVPPGIALLSEVVEPWQSVFVPVMGAGGASTVSVAVIVHPAVVV